MFECVSECGGSKKGNEKSKMMITFTAPASFISCLKLSQFPFFSLLLVDNTFVPCQGFKRIFQCERMKNLN